MSGIYRKPLEIIFWDVQHGNAIYINTPNGTHIVQDLGTGSYSENIEIFSPINHLRNIYGINILDEVIITHPDLDHIADIINFNKIHVRCLFRPKSISKAEITKKIETSSNNFHKSIFYKYIEIAESYNQPVPRNENPRLPENNGGVNFDVYSPTPDLSTHRINNHSIVSIISFAGIKILLPGDNEAPSWKWLLERDDFRKAIKGTDIFLAPHHGRENGFYAELFEHFKPYLTVVSDGRFCDTSATSRYSARSKGWKVHHRRGGKSERKCVTTRNDGVIHIKLGYNSNRTTFIDVRVD